VQATQQWAHSYPDTYDANGNEGGNLDVCWQLLGLRNNNKRRFKVAT